MTSADIQLHHNKFRRGARVFVWVGTLEAIARIHVNCI